MEGSHRHDSGVEKSDRKEYIPHGSFYTNFNIIEKMNSWDDEAGEGA